MPDYSSKTSTQSRVRLRAARPSAELSERQRVVLRALVAAYVGDGSPVGSTTLSHLLSVPLSSASIRNTLAELDAGGLIDKPHASAGRVPTAEGIRMFVDELLDPIEVGRYERRTLAHAFEAVALCDVPHQASQVLSQYTRQLGFALTPRVDRILLRDLRLIRVSTESVIAILVTQAGEVRQRLVADSGQGDQTELDRIAQQLASRLESRTLAELREVLEAEQDELRNAADRQLQRMWALGLAACTPQPGDAESLVIATRLALLEQPEFADPERIRALFSAIETNQQLLEVLHRIVESHEAADGIALSVSLGEELDEPMLRDCALLAIPYDAEFGGEGVSARGLLGVIGPQRMDYGRIIPLVSYCSELVTSKLNA